MKMLLLAMAVWALTVSATHGQIRGTAAGSAEAAQRLMEWKRRQERAKPKTTPKPKPTRRPSRPSPPTGIVDVEAAQQPEQEKTGAAAYDIYREPYRSLFIDNWQRKVVATRASIEKATNNPRPINTSIRQAGETREQTFARKQRDREKDLERAKATLASIEKNSGPVWPLICTNARAWKPGMIGKLDSCRLNINQVIDDKTMLVTVEDPFTELTRQVMFSGFPTQGITDGQQVNGFSRLAVVTGTTTYATALGSTNTVLKVEELHLEAIKASESEIKARAEARSKLAAEAAQKAAEEKAAIEAKKWRTWTTADGKYTVEAKFIKYAVGTLTLERKDGTTVDVELDRLCQEDQDFIRQRKTKSR